MYSTAVPVIKKERKKRYPHTCTCTALYLARESLNSGIPETVRIFQGACSNLRGYSVQFFSRSFKLTNQRCCSGPTWPTVGFNSRYFRKKLVTGCPNGPHVKVIYHNSVQFSPTLAVVFEIFWTACLNTGTQCSLTVQGLPSVKALHGVLHSLVCPLAAMI